MEVLAFVVRWSLRNRAVVLVATGMARASGASRRRAAIATAVLYVAWVAVVGVALPAATAAAPGGGP